MIFETATVVAVEPEAVWVEAVQKSACESCTARAGCGTSVLSKLTGKTTRIRVLKVLGYQHEPQVGEDVTIAIPADVVVTASLLVYLLPLVLSIVGLWLLGAESEINGIIGAITGLVAGGTLVSLFSRRIRNNPRYNPVLYEPASHRYSVDLS
jgi:sigma-E factor negative regulatory protein RseC